jgi:hypothetical protein
MSAHEWGTWMNLNRFVFAVEIAKVAAAPRLSSGGVIIAFINPRTKLSTKGNK